MPTCLSHCLQFLCFHGPRSRSPPPPFRGHRDATRLSPSCSPGLVLSSASESSHPPFTLAVSEQHRNAATGTSCALAKENIDPDRVQNFPGPPHDSVPGESTNQLMRASGTVTHSSVAPSNSHLSDELAVTSPDPQRHPDSHLPESSGQYLSQQENKGMFNRAHDFSVTGNFIDISGTVGNVTLTNNINTSNKFMRELLKETIPGAASDSSARDPPPRCHPGTRLAILKRCIDFIANCSGTGKIRWVVGAAGVGKSAIMQNVAESPKLLVSSQASVFFSFNGRNDGTKAIVTLSYQLAAKSEPYRLLIEHEIDRDPSILHSSISVQFRKLIIEPFIQNPSLNSTGRVLIIIDGLDECKNPRTQQELLRLISDFCITYPSSPVVWLIASRPEPHITSFFSKRKIIPTYEKEEIAVDSDEARADVERYLRHELTEIKETSDSLDPAVEWPEEQDLWKLANASGGLFAYAETVIRYIGDSLVGNPASQLSDVLNVIDNHPMPNVPRDQHPMALLDALYTRILSNVPLKGLANTRKLLLALASDWGSSLFERESNFIVLCNWLAMTPDEAYAAINHLRSVLRVPKRDKAHQEILKPFHKSFIDYISDFTRSEFSPDIKHEAQQLKTQCTFRILGEAPDGVDFGEAHYALAHGRLIRGPGKGDKISLSWLIDEKDGWNDNGTRLSVYKLALGKVGDGMKNCDPTFQTEFCIRLLTTRFEVYRRFPHYELCDLVFDESRRDEFMANGILKQTSLGVVNLSSIFNQIRLQFRRSVARHKSFSDPWNLSCNHEREGKWEGRDQDWTTTFRRTGCVFCFERLERQFESLKIKFLDHNVPILFSSTGDCCIELRFVDPLDGASEWRYLFWIDLPPKERKKYGSSV